MKNNDGIQEYAAPPLADEVCEAVVLGSIIGSATALSTARERLTADCFTTPKHKAIFHAIKTLDDNGDNVDVITVWQELQKNPPLFTMSVNDVLGLTEHSAIFIEEYAQRLVNLSKRRSFDLIAAKFRQAAHNESINIEQLLSSAREDLENLIMQGGENSTTLADSISNVKTIITNNKAGKKSQGTKTGFALIDKYGGFHGSDFIVVAGDTSAGKTAFALSVTRNMVLNGEPVAYYSMEMQHYQLTARIIAMQSGVTSSAILYKPLSDYDTTKIDYVAGQLIDKNLYYDDKSLLSLDTIMVSIRSLYMKYKIKGAFIDYLQISKEQATADAARKLKNLAKNLNIWIVALSQLSRRNNRADTSPMPTMDRLRGSGQIAEAADTVLLVFRPEYYSVSEKFPKPYQEENTHNKAMIIVPKGRNVGIGSFICNFIPELTLFTEAAITDLPIVSNGEQQQSFYHNEEDENKTNDLGDELPF